MTQSITLTASMRSNLASLKNIQGQMDTTQNRLSTGKKVNSAIDNASSYYQSRSLSNRAADLDSLLDSMGQGIQTIQAANEGIEAVTSYIEQAKSIASSAFGLDSTAEDYVTQLTNYENQFNQIVKEIDTLAKDSSYQGINLLTKGKLTVMFNETRTHWLDVQGKDIVGDMAADEIGFKAAEWTKGGETEAAALEAAKEATATAKENMETAATTVEDALGTPATDITADNLATKIATTGKSVYSKVTDADGISTYTKLSTGASFDANATYYFVDTDATIDTKIDTYQNETTGKVKLYKDAVEAQKTAQTNYDNTIRSSASEAIDASLDAVAKATNYLRDYASELGNNFSIIETRQNFTDAVIDVLETGSDNLVLADMNEESANYLALQTRQQLAINSLALSSQSAQSVLSLFS